MPSHTIGVMSTPKAGGTAPRMARNKGSVGHATIFHGNSFNFVAGYQDKTTRHSLGWKNEGECQFISVYEHRRARGVTNSLSARLEHGYCIDVRLTMAKERRLRSGSNTSDSGFTHGSVSANNIPAEAMSCIELTSTIFSDDTLAADVAAIGAMGANADAIPTTTLAINNRIIFISTLEST